MPDENGDAEAGWIPLNAARWGAAGPPRAPLALCEQRMTTQVGMHGDNDEDVTLPVRNTLQLEAVLHQGPFPLSVCPSRERFDAAVLGQRGRPFRSLLVRHGAASHRPDLALGFGTV